MKNNARLNIRIKQPGFWICVGGYAVLALAYILWLAQSGSSLWGKLLALASVAMFSLVCLNFVPGWMKLWDRRCPDTPLCSERAPRRFLPSLFLFGLIYCLCIILLVYLIRGLMGHGWDFADYIGFWTGTDSYHYLCIARDWYLSVGHWDRLVQLVFLPGYPIAIRIANLIIGNWLYSGLCVSALCFSGALCAFYSLVRIERGHRCALRALKFLCLIPGAFFFAAPMSESLFLLLCCLCLYFGRRRKWLAACLFGALASFTRSLGMSLFVPLLFEMLSCCIREKGKARFGKLALLLVIPAGFAAYCYINYRVAGDPFKYMEYQSQHWGQNLGLFFNTAAYQLDNAIARFGSDRALFWGLWLPNLMAQFLSLGIMIPAAKGLRPAYSAWFIAYYFVAIGATWLLSAPRYLAALPVLPMALAAVGENRKFNAAATALCLMLGAAYLLAFAARWQVW